MTAAPALSGAGKLGRRWTGASALRAGAADAPPLGSFFAEAAPAARPAPRDACASECLLFLGEKSEEHHIMHGHLLSPQPVIASLIHCSP